MRPYHFATGFTLAVALALGTPGCNDPLLADAIFRNRVDTVSLYALDGTPVASHSGYNVASLSTVRTDQTTGFDFVFNIDTLGRAVLLSASALNLSGGSGLLPTATPFAELRFAPQGSYNTDSAVVVTPGDVVAIRSSLVRCELGNLFYYGKLGVIAVDSALRRITFEILSNINCGYRSLEPGLPKQ